MDDGNKESIKELLAAFRIVASADLSILLAAIAIETKIAAFRPSLSYFLALVFLAASLATCIYLFLLCIRKLAAQTPSIIEDPPVKYTAAAALTMMLLGIVFLICHMLIG